MLSNYYKTPVFLKVVFCLSNIIFYNSLNTQASIQFILFLIDITRIWLQPMDFNVLSLYLHINQINKKLLHEVWCFSSTSLFINLKKNCLATPY